MQVSYFFANSCATGIGVVSASRIAVSLLIAVTYSGCSLSSGQFSAEEAVDPSTHQNHSAASDESLRPSVSQDGLTPPIEIRILSERRIGNLLTVKVELVPKTDLQSNAVAVSLLGLADGHVVARETLGLDQVTGDDGLDEGEALPVLLSVTHPDLNEYQVHAAWGADRDALSPAQPVPLADANQAPPEREESAALSARITGLKREDQQCADDPCSFKYVVSIELHNKSDNVTLGDVVLAAGLVWVKTGSATVFRKDWAELAPEEEALPLAGLTLRPREHRELRIRLDTLVPVLTGGELRPSLRVLSGKPVR